VSLVSEVTAVSLVDIIVPTVDTVIRRDYPLPCPNCLRSMESERGTLPPRDLGDARDHQRANATRSEVRVVSSPSTR
jgi:hypothetical protein